jgi:signal transduction histidine kinase
LLIIPSRTRIKRLGAPSGAPLPNALAAVPIQSLTGITGFFWVAYMQPHRFLDAEVKFLNTLTGQAGLAVSNANLYASAEVGKRRLESVLRSTPEPVLVVNRDGGLLLVNAAAEQLEDLISPENLDSGNGGFILSEKLTSFIQNEAEKGDAAEELILENGHTYLVSLSDVSTEELKGGMVCVLRDITEYKKLEKLKSEYVATVSHDLKNPLGMMRGYATMIQMVGDLNEQQKTYTAKVIEEIDNIARMADNLLDVGRMDSGVDLQIEKISPSLLIDDVIALLQPQAMNRKVQILKELTLSQELTLEGDRTLLQRALYNLIDNAVKFSPISGHVNLRLDSKDKEITFVIQDHGPGIAPLDLKTIFDGYTRAGKSETSGQRATGLGLSIVRSVADRHGGKVWAESNLGKGSTFFLQVPQRQSLKNAKKSKG